MDDDVVPINWIHLSSDRKKIIVNNNNESPPSPTGLLLLQAEPLGDTYDAVSILSTFTDGYDSTKVGIEKHQDDEWSNFPGPITWALPLTDESELNDLTQKGMNSILNLLSTLVQKEVELGRRTSEDYKENFNFTVENIDEELLASHPDAIMGVLCTDGDATGEGAVPLFRVWVMLYRWVEMDGGQWTWK
jgi:hypothetical protein